MINMDYMFSEKKCPVCGKEFVVRDVDAWVFKRKSYGYPKYFCTWSCTKKFDAEHMSKKDKRHNVIEALKKDVPISKIVERYGVDYSMVKYWKRKLDKESEEQTEEDIPVVQGY